MRPVAKCGGGSSRRGDATPVYFPPSQPRDFVLQVSVVSSSASWNSNLPVPLLHVRRLGRHSAVRRVGNQRFTPAGRPLGQKDGRIVRAGDILLGAPLRALVTERRLGRSFFVQFRGFLGGKQRLVLELRGALQRNLGTRRSRCPAGPAHPTTSSARARSAVRRLSDPGFSASVRKLWSSTMKRPRVWPSHQSNGALAPSSHHLRHGTFYRDPFLAASAAFSSARSPPSVPAIASFPSWHANS